VSAAIVDLKAAAQCVPLALTLGRFLQIIGSGTGAVGGPRACGEKAAERETRRPLYARCGAKFIDERWRAIEPTGWDAPRETHPHLCDDCKQRATTTEHQAEHTKHGH
jgi:hypothetical protein